MLNGTGFRLLGEYLFISLCYTSRRRFSWTANNLYSRSLTPSINRNILNDKIQQKHKERHNRDNRNGKQQCITLLSLLSYRSFTVFLLQKRYALSTYSFIRYLLVSFSTKYALLFNDPVFALNSDGLLFIYKFLCLPIKSNDSSFILTYSPGTGIPNECHQRLSAYICSEWGCESGIKCLQRNGGSAVLRWDRLLPFSHCREGICLWTAFYYIPVMNSLLKCTSEIVSFTRSASMALEPLA